MIPIFQKHGAAIIYVITAIVIIGVSLWTRSDTAWLLILCIGIALASLWDVYFKTKKGRNE